MRPASDTADLSCVADGVWAVRMPLERSPVGYSLAYLVEHDAGLLAMDAGYRSGTCWAALEAAADRIGCGVGAITGVVLTHNHPDHVGLAHRVRDFSGAWIALHSRDLPRAGGFACSVAIQLGLAGVPARERPAMLAASRRHAAAIDGLEVNRRLDDGDAVGAPGARCRVVWTPGHTPGHVALHLTERSLLIGGDLLLPGGDPQMALITAAADDPVRDFLASLERVEALGVTTVLPGHGGPFTAVGDRIAAIRARLARRLEAAAEVVARSQSERTAWEVAPLLPARRPWRELSVLGRRSATLSAHALLRALAGRGLVRATPGRPERYCAAD